MKYNRASSVLTALALLALFCAPAMAQPGTTPKTSGSAPAGPVATETSDTAATPATAPISPEGATGSATASLVAERVPPPANSTDTYLLWQDSVQSCVDEGGPIDIDEYFMALSDLDKAGDATLYNYLRDLMTCGQLADTSKAMCSGDALLVEPFFAETSEYAPGRSLSKKERKRAEELVDKAGKDCLDSAVHYLIYKGEKSFLGKDVAAGICSLFGDKAGDGCEAKFNSYLAAIDKGDPAMCGAVSKYEDQEYCLLFTSRNPNVCKNDSFKDIQPEHCQDELTTFKILRKIPLAKDETLISPDGPLSVYVKFEADKSYCDVLYREKLLPAFCLAKHLPALKQVIEGQKGHE